MTPRQRKSINQPLRPGMRVRDGYYSWTNPETGKEYGLGRDPGKAIKEVIAVEIKLASKHASLVDRVSGAVNTWAEWCDKFEAILTEREIDREAAKATVKVRRTYMNRLRDSFDANVAASRIGTKECAEIIDAIVKQGKSTTAHAFRAFLIDCFDRMIAKGWREDNPARLLDEVRIKVRRARLTLDAFQKIYETTSFVWLRNAMALSIVSGQPRESVAGAQFADIRDGAWWSERGKTGARMIIPLELRLAAVNLSLEDVVRQCRTTGVMSKHLIHQTKRARGARLGKRMNMATITKTFQAEVAALGIDWGVKSSPSFHEIRSLSERLYDAQGDVKTQDLLGHKSARTTALYHDSRGDWVRVAIGKKS